MRKHLKRHAVARNIELKAQGLPTLGKNDFQSIYRWGLDLSTATVASVQAEREKRKLTRGRGTKPGAWTDERRAKFQATMRKKARLKKQNGHAHPAAAAPAADDAVPAGATLVPLDAIPGLDPKAVRAEQKRRWRLARKTTAAAAELQPAVLRRINHAHGPDIDVMADLIIAISRRMP